MVELIHSAQCAGITAKYVLFGSWFSAPKTILELKKQGHLNIIDALMDTVIEYFHIAEAQLEEFTASFV